MPACKADKLHIVITADAFQRVLSKCYDCDIPIFNYCFFLVPSEVDFERNEWEQLKTVDVETVVGEMLYSHWWGWDTTNQSLSALDKLYPDALYFCSAKLGDLRKANCTLGEDMLLTPRLLVMIAQTLHESQNED